MLFSRTFLNFDIVNILWSGSNGTIYAAVDCVTGTKVTIKYIKKEGRHKRNINFEPKMQSILDHENICKLYGCLDTPSNLVLIMEFVDGVNLLTYLKKNGKFCEDLSRHVFIQIARAVDYLHAHFIVHKDIKLENIILDNDFGVKICDFGLSEFCDELCTLEECYRMHASPEVDVWHLGVVLYTIVHGRFPFEREEDKCATQFRAVIDKSLSSELKTLIKILIEQRGRIKMSEMMSHPWLGATRSVYMKSITFLDSDIIKKLSEIGFETEGILKNILHGCSKESATYSLIRKKLVSGYSSKTIGCVIPYHSCDIIDLNIINVSDFSRNDLKEMEMHRILRSVYYIRRNGCFSFLFWNWKRSPAVRRDICASLRTSKILIERHILRIPKSAISKLEKKYTITFESKMEIDIELIETDRFTACIFILSNGEIPRFVNFVADMILVSNEEDSKS